VTVTWPASEADAAALMPRIQDCFAQKEISEEAYVDLLAGDTMTQPSTLRRVVIARTESARACREVAKP